MTNEDPSSAAAAGAGGRTPRQGSGGSPVGSTLSIVLAVLALVAGFLILRNITDDNSSSGSAGSGSGEPVTTGNVTTTTFDISDTTTTTTTTIPRVTEGAIVVVANANTVGGSAGRMSKTLETVGYTMGSPVNATVTLDDTLVYYDASNASAEAVAQSVGIDMGCVDVAAAPTPPPTSDGSLGEAGVLVVLGNNEADKTIEEMAIAGCGVTPSVTETTVAGSSEEPIAPTSVEEDG